MPDTSSFREAVAEANRPCILLGNGFSIALRPDIFSYVALRDRAMPGGISPAAWEAFDLLDTNDFEVVMRGLLVGGDLVESYGEGHVQLAAQMRNDAAALREVLVQTIAASHPDHPFEIDEESYDSCRQFLAPFKNIYSLNYDLLLYWTLMQELEPQVKCDDGFRNPDEEGTTSVTWDPDAVGSQNVFYLHGALHLFDAGAELQKYTWSKTGVRLVDQIREAMLEGKFPHFVAESASREKLARIRHSAYLSRGERSLYSIGGDLFTFGFAMSDNDAHVLRAIRKNKVRTLYVGLYGDPTSEENRTIERRALQLSERRRGVRLEVKFYDSESARPWG